jgi:hypothetical protein
LEIRRDGVLMPPEMFDMKSFPARELLAPRFVLNEDISLIRN